MVFRTGTECHSHREWFHSTPRLRDAIRKILADGNLDWAKAALKPSGDVRSPLSRKRTPEQRLRMSYSHRINWATRKLRTDKGYFCAPSEVSAIMGRWQGHYRRCDGVEPTVAEFAVLERFLADPANLSVFVPFHRPKLVSPVPQETAA